VVNAADEAIYSSKILASTTYKTTRHQGPEECTLNTVGRCYCCSRNKYGTGTQKVSFVSEDRSFTGSGAIFPDYMTSHPERERYLGSRFENLKLHRLYFFKNFSSSLFSTARS
jgi:hypothetical protein